MERLFAFGSVRRMDITGWVVTRLPVRLLGKFHLTASVRWTHLNGEVGEVRAWVGLMYDGEYALWTQPLFPLPGRRFVEGWNALEDEWLADIDEGPVSE